MSKPFAGVRILDFTRYLAGPYGTYQLALLGADVVKIESHEGDETRGQLADKKWAERKMAPSFLAVNGNKRSITLDLRKPEAVEIVKRLVAGADVVWENFRGGVMDRLGLGYEALSAINPRLIYCGVSGFGRTGPEKTTAAFDGKLQAMSGIMSITGEPANGPTRAGFAICDTIGGVTAALAVASALFQRTHTGRGQLVDVAMLDAALAFIPGPVSEYTVAGIEQRQIGNGSVSRKPDGQPLPDARRLHRAGGAHREAVREPHEGARAARRARRTRGSRTGPRAPRTSRRCARSSRRALATDDSRSWEARLTAADVPCGSIWKIHEIVDHPQLEHRDVLQTIDSRYGPMRLVGAGFRLEHGSPGIDREPPTLGEHTDEILGRPATRRPRSSRSAATWSFDRPHATRPLAERPAPPGRGVWGGWGALFEAPHLQLILAELQERDATGAIAGIYAEIRRLWAVPYVSSLQRHLATRPGWLEWTWAALAPAFTSGRAQRVAWRAADTLSVPRLAPITRDALHVWGVDDAGQAAIRATAASFVRVARSISCSRDCFVGF